MKVFRNCCVCGKEYEYCPVCGEDAHKPTWYNSFDSENCKNIYEACAAFGMNQISKEEAAEKIKDCDFTDKANYTDSTKRLLSEILGYDIMAEKKVEEPEKVEEPKKVETNSAVFVKKNKPNVKTR